MGKKNREYVSIFTINGKPILPPLMTENKRIEMRSYREIAKKIENTNNYSHKLNRPTTIAVPLNPNSTSDTESQLTLDSYLKVSNILKNCAESKRNNTLVKLKKSETLIYDLLNNSLITSNVTCTSNENSSPEHKSDYGAEMNVSPPSNIIKRLFKCNETNGDSSKADSNFLPINLMNTPTIEIIPATPVAQSKPIVPENILVSKDVFDNDVIPIGLQRSMTSPSLLSDDSPDSTLVRSNSFTLENPSKALLDHMKKLKIETALKKQSTATKDTIESNAKKVQKVIPKTSSFANKNLQKSKPLPTISNIKSRRSPYDFKISSSKGKLRKHKSNTACGVKGKTSVTIVRKDEDNNNSPNLLLEKSPTSKKLIANNNNTQNSSLSNKPKSPGKRIDAKSIENYHREKLLELILSQKEEQKRMQIEFAKQQSDLIKQLSLESPKSDTVFKTTPTIMDKPVLEIARKSSATPRRQLFPKVNSSEIDIQKEIAQNKRRNLAATKINALVRGYLTRRLFKTDYVQRVVQTIRDTLIFVLDLHMETANDESEENTRLKARLLQQLSSACDCLHKIFFELATKDRMAIISKDRKYIKNKMANLILSSRR